LRPLRRAAGGLFCARRTGATSIKVRIVLRIRTEMRKLCLHPRFMLPSSFNYVTLVPDSRAHIGIRQSNGGGRPAAHPCLGTNVERCRLRYGKTEWTWKTVGAGLVP